MAYSMLGGIWQLQGGWSATTNKQDFHQNGSSVNTGAWYLGVAYALTLGGRDTNFNITYGQSYNAENIPMQHQTHLQHLVLHLQESKIR